MPTVKLISFRHHADMYTMSTSNKSNLIHDEGSESHLGKHEKYKRTDFGFLESFLKNGCDVNIRPATLEEFETYKKL